MKQLALASLVLFLAMMACSPLAAPISAADSQATSMASIETQAALTMVSRPTLEPSRTPEPTATLLVAPSATSTESAVAFTETSTATVEAAASAVSATPTFTVTAAGPTATPSPTASATASATATFSGTFTATFTFTPGVLTYGTIPPEVPYGYVTLRNLSNDMAYVAFRCAMTNGLTSLLEYPVYSVVKEKLPTGVCQWTAFVKKQEFKGELHVKKFEEYTFTLKPKKVSVTSP